MILLLHMRFVIGLVHYIVPFCSQARHCYGRWANTHACHQRRHSLCVVRLVEERIRVFSWNFFFPFNSIEVRPNFPEILFRFETLNRLWFFIWRVFFRSSFGLSFLNKCRKETHPMIWTLYIVMTLAKPL